MDLTIVIPVLNEEQSIERVARGCLEARRLVVSQTPVDNVHVVVVSDGSSDRTVEIARSISEVTTIVFEKNRGYGAAIMRGWEERPSELLGFLDGDGTCDPEFFVNLVRVIERSQADIVLGSRLGPQSKMPPLRRFGNFLFALLLGLLSRKPVSDSASGMRVVRRSSLHRLLPLPVGLHFTPAMSARAVMGEMNVVEVPMPYAERMGRSKLRVIEDGFRFLGVILSAAAYIRPSRLTFPLIGLLLVFCLGLGIGPVMHYLEHRSVEEDMIYRFLFIYLVADVGVVIFCATLIAEHVIAIGLLQYGSFIQRTPWWFTRTGLRLYLFLSALFLAVGIYLIGPGLHSYLLTRTIPFATMHWSRVVVAAFSALTFLQLASTWLIVSLLDSIHIRQKFLLPKNGK